jgi:hypothetical protein
MGMLCHVTAAGRWRGKCPAYSNSVGVPIALQRFSYLLSTIFNDYSTLSLMLVCNRVYPYYPIQSHTLAYVLLHYNRILEIGYIALTELVITLREVRSAPRIIVRLLIQARWRSHWDGWQRKR